MSDLRKLLNGFSKVIFMSLQLTNHFVAFIDILGFSEMVRSDCESAGEPKYLELLHSAHQNAQSMFGQDIEAGLMQFSDSIVFSRPFDLSQLGEFLSSVSEWQKALLLSGLLCRGGVTFGKHFVKDRFLFSKGLIDAYFIESTQARFPRIVVSNDLIQLAGDQVDFDGLSVLTEEDSAVFVDYLGYANDVERAALEEAVGKLCSNASSSPSVREKLRWLAHYADYKLGSSLAGPRFA